MQLSTCSYIKMMNAFVIEAKKQGADECVEKRERERERGD
jgi:hypothetical protein